MTVQRELFITVAINKKVCPNCEATDCHGKCRRCMSLAYCSKECQVSDWAKHKVICKTFGHIIHMTEQWKETVDESTFRMFIDTRISEVFCLSLIVLGIDAQVIYQLPVFKGCTRALALPTVVANGRAYNIAYHFTDGLLPFGIPSGSVQIPLPGDITKYELVNLLLKAVHDQFKEAPWLVPRDLDKEDFEIMRMYLCRSAIVSYCFKYDTHFASEIFREDVIKTAFGETREEFKKRMDAWIDGWMQPAGRDEAYMELSRVSLLNKDLSSISFKKKETLIRCARSLRFKERMAMSEFLR